MHVRSIVGLIFLVAAGCADSTSSGLDGGFDAGTKSPTVEVRVATWNLGLFPETPESPALYAETISEMDLDLLAVQEVQDPAAFADLVNALDGYQGVLATPQGGATPIRVGMIWRPARLTLVSSEELFVGDPLFPRPVLRADFGVEGTAARFSALTAHLKAGTRAEDEQQRIEAASALNQTMSGVEIAGEDEVLLLGDLNESFGDPRAGEFFGKFEGEPGYTVLTRVFEQSGEVTFVPAGIVLDHLVASPGLQEEIGDRVPETVPQAGSALSDHHPVRMELHFEAAP